jgi:hypothetical protein
MSDGHEGAQFLSPGSEELYADIDYPDVSGGGVPYPEVCSDPPGDSCSDADCPVHGWDYHDDKDKYDTGDEPW